jgi:transcriptional regulator with XRE-family HTH domain
VKVHPVVDAIRQARLACGWTRAQLATAAGMHLRTIDSWETGASTPNVEHAGIVLAALGLRLTAVPATGRAWLLVVEVDDRGQPAAARAIGISTPEVAA